MPSAEHDDTGDRATAQTANQGHHGAPIDLSFTDSEGENASEIPVVFERSRLQLHRRPMFDPEPSSRVRQNAFQHRSKTYNYHRKSRLPCGRKAYVNAKGTWFKKHRSGCQKCQDQENIELKDQLETEESQHGGTLMLKWDVATDVHISDHDSVSSSDSNNNDDENKNKKEQEEAERSKRNNAPILHHKLLQVATQRLPSDAAGYLYLLRNAENPGLLKLGCSVNPLRRGHQVRSQCGFPLTWVYISNRVEKRIRVEKLAKLDMSHLQRDWRCSSCSQTHTEWFEVDEEKAKKVVDRWVGWVNEQTPYTRLNSLEPIWMWLMDFKRTPQEWFAENDHEARWAHWDSVLQPPSRLDMKTFNDLVKHSPFKGNDDRIMMGNQLLHETASVERFGLLKTPQAAPDEATQNDSERLGSFPAGLEQAQSVLRSNHDLETTKQTADDSDTLVVPSVFSINHHASSTEATLVNSDTSPPKFSSFTLFNYETLPAEVPEVDGSDIESILSRDDISQAGTTASMVAYQHAATDIITKVLLEDDELSRTYRQAIKRVGQERFLRNNRKLLQWLSEDLKASQLLPSEHLTVRFLGRYKGSQRVSAAICHELIGTKLGHQEQLKLSPSKDRSLILNRFLKEADSAEPFEESKLGEPAAGFSDGGDSDVVSSGDEEEDDHQEIRTEKLEATVKFLVSGQAFQTYKQRLLEWLHPPLLAHTIKQDDVADTVSSSDNVFFAPGLIFSTETTDAPIADNAVIQHTKDDFGRAGEYALPESKFTAPLILSDDRDDPSRYGVLVKSQSTAVAVQPKATVHDPIFSLSLPLLVDKILRRLPLPIFEPVVPKGRTRVRWTSSSKSMFDDYVELDPGAAVELETALQKRYTPPEQVAGDGKATSGLIQRFINVFRQQDGRLQQPRSDAEQGGHALQAPSDGLVAIADAGTVEREDEIQRREALRLLLCVDDGRSKMTLKQEILHNINDDRELFTYLRKRYFMKRSWFALRSVGALSLAQFEVNYSNTTNVYRHESVCRIATDEQLDRALGLYCLCIPPEERVGYDKEYLCNPAPKSRKRRLVPVLGPTMLKGDFLNPEFIAAGQRTTLNQLPKRRLEEELKATPDDLATGWGLHVEEDWHWPTIYCCFVAIIMFSLTFGIVWSVKRHDIQGAFAVSGFALTLGAMFLGYMAIPRS